MTCLLLAAATLSRAQVPGYGVPSYPVTYQMNRSTVIMPCNYSGYLDPASIAGWDGGLMDVDWSNGKAEWVKQQPMEDETMLLEQFKQLKALDKGNKVWLYRGTIYAYPWYKETRLLLDDPAYDPWFLKFAPNLQNYTSPKCDVNGSGAAKKCTEYYHTQEQTPMFPVPPDTAPLNRGQCADPGCDCGTKPCGFYMYNHSAANVVVKGQTLRDWLINSYVLANADGVDGFYFDDYWNADKKPVTEDYAAGMVEDTGLTHAQLLDITINYNATMRALYNATLAAGKIGWQMCYGGSIYDTRYQKVTQKNCVDSLRLHCAADSPTQTRAYLAAPRHPAVTIEDLTNFLLIRGPYAWFGYGWQGCGTYYPYNASVMNADYGEPTALCKETAEGSEVFRREWTKSTVEMDCKTWTSTITLK